MGKSKTTRRTHSVVSDTTTPSYFVNDVFEWKKRFYLKKSTSPTVFTVVDTNRSIIEEVTIRKEVKDDGTEKLYEGKKKLLARFSVGKIFEYEPLDKDMSPTYSMNINKKNKQQIEIKNGAIDEILGQLRAHGGIIVQSSNAINMVNDIIALAEETGNLMHKYEPPYPGFFWKDNKVVATVEYDYPNATEVREALELLHEFADYFEEFKEGLGFCLHWQIMAPFSFIKKQKGSSNKIGALYLYGSSRAGKTTTALLSSHIWGRDITDCFVGAGSVHSEASYGRNISRHTFPVVLDEAERVFDPKYDGLNSTFKNSIFYTYARGRYSPTTGRYENIPALSPPIITSNASQPTNAALGARLNSLEYIMNRPRTKEEIIEFSHKFDPENSQGPLKALVALGGYAANYIIDNPELLDKDWERVSEEIWQSMYEYGGVEIPAFMQNCGNALGLDEAWEEEENELYTMFHRLVLRNADPGINFETLADGKTKVARPVSIEDKVEDVTKNARETWISFYSPVRGPDAGKEFVVVDSGISKDLMREYSKTVSLKILASNLNAEYTSVRRGTRHVKVARWEYKDFLAMFVSVADDGDMLPDEDGFVEVELEPWK